MKPEMINYQEYLKSSIWKYKRECLLKEQQKPETPYKYECEVCKQIKVKGFMHIHHTTYRNLGNEPADELLCCCKDCHKKIHDNHNLTQITDKQVLVQKMRERGLT